MSESATHDTSRERISVRTDLEVLISFDLIITTSIMQSAVESVSVSVNREEVERAQSVSATSRRVAVGHQAQ